MIANSFHSARTAAETNLLTETNGTCYVGLEFGRKVYIQLFNVVANNVLDASIDRLVGNDFLKTTDVLNSTNSW